MEPLSDDLKELIGLFTSTGVEFLIVGAHALAFHALPRQTIDLDLWVRRSEENAARIRQVLDSFGFKIGDQGQHLLKQDKQLLQLGVPPNRVDILTFLDGCDFDRAWAAKEAGILQGEKVFFLSLPDYVATKKASGRPKDTDDLNRLRESLGGKLPGDAT
ncbi:hypothetical protein [Fimbriimonas ginsengisoli]|uniref:hypothetical protein n=1 Tax=Fimbriimonas ginsengisoli TaxID=1005039 RepID=UPI00046D9318|nr:hypothetical protein [Fimbriimonas ginsengisoli]